MTTPGTTPHTTAPTAYAKGSTLHATLAWVRRAADDAAAERVLARLAPADAAAVAAAQATDEVPFALVDRLSRAVEAELGALHPDWAEAIGALAIESLGVQRYGNLLRRASPAGFLTQEVSLFRLYYHPGDMRPVEVEETAEGGRVVLRLDGFGHAAHGSTWFCRRQTGGLTRAAALAGGERVRARHVRCALEGDAFCEWELRWAARTPARGG